VWTLATRTSRSSARSDAAAAREGRIAHAQPRGLIRARQTGRQGELEARNLEAAEPDDAEQDGQQQRMGDIALQGQPHERPVDDDVQGAQTPRRWSRPERPAS
jgi:hypothetical protein